VLLGPAAWTLAATAVLVLVAAVSAGSAASYGALAGGLLVLVVFGLGTGIVAVVTRSLPAASLLVALLTYTLQVVAMAAAFAMLDGSDLLEETLDRRWLGGAVILGTVTWLTAQVLRVTRRRIPAYDVPVPGAGHRPEAGAR
jgi:ATP synthase protein I